MPGIRAAPAPRRVSRPRRRLGGRAREAPVGVLRRTILAVARARVRRPRALGSRGDRHRRRFVSALPTVGCRVRTSRRDRVRGARRRSRRGRHRRAVAPARRSRRRHVGRRRATVPERPGRAARGRSCVLRRRTRDIRRGAGDGAAPRARHARPRPRRSRGGTGPSGRAHAGPHAWASEHRARGGGRARRDHRRPAAHPGPGSPSGVAVEPRRGSGEPGPPPGRPCSAARPARGGSSGCRTSLARSAWSAGAAGGRSLPSTRGPRRR